MYRIIGADQKEYGPVPEEKLRQWIRQNRANAQTQVRQAGEGEWKPLGVCPEFAADLDINQRAAPSSTRVTPALAEADYARAVLANRARVDIGLCLSRGWNLLKSRFGLLTGATFLTALVLTGCSAVPLLGAIVNLILSGPMEGGLFLLFLKAIRGQAVDLSDAFTGFGPSFVPLMWAQIVTSLLTLLSAALFLAAVGLGIALKNVSTMPVMVGLGFVGLLPAIYLSVAWYFTLALVIDREMDFGAAMSLSRKKVTQNWWPVFGLLAICLVAVVLGAVPYAVGFVEGIAPLAVAGTVAFGIVLVLVLPTMIGAMMYAYADLFRTPAA